MDRETLETIRKEAVSQRDWFRKAAKEKTVIAGSSQYRSGLADAYKYIIDLINEMLESC